MAVHFCAYDANGNVSALVNSSAGASSGAYDYDPFGKCLRTTGAAASANPLRFSTQFWDQLLETTKYLHRDQHTSSGRWLNRDPIGEQGGIGLQVFLDNEPVSGIDRLGLAVLAAGRHLNDLLEWCGSFRHRIYWELQQGKSDATVGGTIVQHVNATFDVWHCGPPATRYFFYFFSPVSLDPSDWPFYEAWTIPPSEARPNIDRHLFGGYDDSFQMPTFGVCTRGTIVITATAEYYDGFTLPLNFGVDNAGPPRNGLPTADSFLPPGFPDSSVSRTVTATWDCCTARRRTTVTPPN